jgi:superfamily II DNA or RNA helicase
MSSIQLFKQDETYLIIDAPLDVLEDISEKYRYDSGANSFVLRKRKGWDGQIRLLNKKTGEFPIGLFIDVAKYIQKEYPHYELKIDPNLYYTNPVSMEEIVEWTKTFKLTAGGTVIEPYWYQFLILYRAIKFTKKAFSAATSSGKSLSIYLITKFLIENCLDDSVKVLIIVPSITLLEQFYNDFVDYSQQNHFNVEQNTYKISAGVDKYTKKQIIISTWQSLQNIKGRESKDYFNQFGCVIVDEAQSSDAVQLTRIIKLCKKAFYKVALTGTFKEAKTSKLVVKSLFGTVSDIVSAKDIQTEGQATEVEVIVHQLKYPKSECAKVCKMKYQQEIDYIVSHEKRNQYIFNLAKTLSGNTLLLFNYVEKHGEVLLKMFEDGMNGRMIHFISGKTNKEIRIEIKDILEKNSNCILIGSYGTVATGFSIKNLHNIISVAPFKSKVRTMQSAGRGMRLHESKEKFFYHDIVDNFSHGTDENYALDHGRKRVSYFAKEFKVKFVNKEI